VELRLDYLSCVLTIFSTILVGRRHWEGWVLAGVNSVIMCLIGLRTSQWGFIPANLFCIVLYAANLRAWRKAVRQILSKRLFNFGQPIGPLQHFARLGTIRRAHNAVSLHQVDKMRSSPVANAQTPLQ
jgi:hypothetical protein